MEPVRPVVSGFFPLDEELALVPGTLAPSIQDHLTHLASWMPFRRAAQMLERLLGVQVSEATIRRHTETVGALYEQQQTAMSQQASPGNERSASASSCGPATRPQWRWRLCGAGQGRLGRSPHAGHRRSGPIGSAEQEVRTHALSYFSRMTDAATFAELAEVETQRRGVVQAEQVCAVTDGAEWLQGFIDLHRADALRILDFPHAAQRFGMIAEAYEQHGHPLPAQWVQQHCHDLKHQGPAGVLERLRALPPLEAGEEHLHYLEKREALMQYPTYRAAGWPIGSGIVESGNKVVMQARLKGAGMRWGPTHVNPMLALRTAVCNDRWDEAWQQVSQEDLQRRIQRRLHRASARLTALLRFVLLAWVRLRPRLAPPPAALPRSSDPPATLPGSCRPSPHHPWKRGPACRPKLAGHLARHSRPIKCRLHKRNLRRQPSRKYGRGAGSAQFKQRSDLKR